MHQSFLVYKNKRYLLAAIAVTGLSVVLFWLHEPSEPPNGGTVLGYVLGTAGALLIVWLSCLGIRKRAYRSQMGTVQGWLSAHVYLGAALLVIGTLHSTGELGWNVHSLAYMLMVIVIFSGFYGVYIYNRYPRRLVLNLDGITRERIRDELNALDNSCDRLAKKSETDVKAAVRSALDRTSLGGSLYRRLSGNDVSRVMLPNTSGGKPVLVANHDQGAVLDFLSQRIASSQGGEEIVMLRDLADMFSERRRLLTVLRRDLQMMEKLRVWLFVHVPLTFALLSALLVHILSVFIYW